MIDDLEQTSAQLEAEQDARELLALAGERAAISSIARIEASGRAALAQMRQILGLLRAEHDSAELRPLLGIEHIHDLIGRPSGAGGLVDLTVTGSPGPLLGGIDVAAYRLVGDVLSYGDAERTAAPTLRRKKVR